eukprot:UN4538
MFSNYAPDGLPVAERHERGIRDDVQHPNRMGEDVRHHGRGEAYHGFPCVVSEQEVEGLQHYPEPMNGEDLSDSQGP